MILFKINLVLILFACIVLPSYAVSQHKYIDTAYEKGYAKDGIKIGKWKYYGASKELELIIDYDSSKIDYFKKDTSKYFIKINDEWQLKELERPVHYIGASRELYNHLAFNIGGPYPFKARKDKISGVVILEIVFDEDGNIISKEVLGKNSQYFEKKLFKLTEDIPGLWMSAIYDNTPVAAKIGIPFVFKIVDGKKKPVDYSIVHNYKGKLLNEILTSAHL